MGKISFVCRYGILPDVNAEANVKASLLKAFGKSSTAAEQINYIHSLVAPFSYALILNHMALKSWQELPKHHRA